jgi:hypothetical protein
MNYRSFAIPSLPNYGTSEAVNLCSRYMEKSTICSEQNSPVILENKISCSPTVTCAISFLSSHMVIQSGAHSAYSETKLN